MRTPTAIHDHGVMPLHRKLVTFGLPVLILGASIVFALMLQGQDATDVATWIGVGGLVVAVLSLIVTWLAWRSPAERETSDAMDRINVHGSQSIGKATGGSQIVIGDHNRVTRSDKL